MHSPVTGLHVPSLKQVLTAVMQPVDGTAWHLSQVWHVEPVTLENRSGQLHCALPASFTKHDPPWLQIVDNAQFTPWWHASKPREVHVSQYRPSTLGPYFATQVQFPLEQYPAGPQSKNVVHWTCESRQE